MKILHVIDSGGLYGAEVMLINLMKAQVELGLSPAIASIGLKSDNNKEIEKTAASVGFALHIFRMRKGPNLYGAIKILRFAQREHFQIIHTHGYKSSILFGIIPGVFRRIPTLATVHGWTAISDFSRMALYEIAESITLPFLDAVVLVSRSMYAKKGCRFINKKKSHVIYNGIERKRVQTETRKKSQIVDFCRRAFTVGAIGRLSSEKAYDILVGAIDILKREGLNVNLVIIGEGPQRKFLEHEVQKKKLSEVVYLPGYIKDAGSYMTYFDVFCISSLTEGLPITLLEAMQAKVPIIATKVGGIPEIIQNGKTGLLVDPGEPLLLASAIKRILFSSSDEINDITTESYKIAIKKFTAHKMARAYLAVYIKLNGDQQRSQVNTKSLEYYS